jgi:hypothetical protein
VRVSATPDPDGFELLRVSATPDPDGFELLLSVATNRTEPSLRNGTFTSAITDWPWLVTMTRDRCYDHNFLRFSTIFGEKICLFLKNQCYDQNFA